ncbi:hypothetical protein AAF712_002529 [Marasmius tenuissimus]|uniref:CxC6 like cysteine cluster associated with KDZ domain-containing protein n=1 Tax=Marasmius tenuissimus TaxID=585030 RepID=A0ABR3A8M8_9AGAR
MSEEEVHASWSSLKDIIWHEDEVFGRVADDGLLNKTFRENGGKLFRECPLFLKSSTAQVKIASTVSLWPPTLKCFNPECPYVKDNKLLKLQGVEERCAVLYTQDKGPVGVLAHHITCHGCKIIYHPTFYVAVDACTGKQYRYYYLGDEVPEVIQINEHRFVETRLMREWRNDMVISNKSATSCATVYHMNTPMPLPDRWPIQGLLRSEYIYDGFKVLSLLEYHIAHSSQLVVSHDGAQINRFDEAMENVNNEISRCGQPEIDHRCQKCVRTISDKDGTKEVFAVVCDGVTVGRPTCGVPHCQGKLLRTMDSFCSQHLSMENICRVVECEAPVVQGFRTCANLDHRAMEEKWRERGQAAFQLKKRYERDHRVDAVTTEEYGPDDDDGLGDSEEKGDESRPLRAHFSRRRTHNEQLIIAPCGMILARQTFYHSEGFSLVARFVKETFTSHRKPNHFIYDSNCILSKHVRNHNDSEMRQFFEDIGLAVDVFHFKSKHKDSDIYCGRNCNPYHFPELIYRDDTGKDRWFFNTSIAEQTNAWFGRFISICREMNGIFYEFFLNQMIMLHNKQVKQNLERSADVPTYWIRDISVNK